MTDSLVIFGDTFDDVLTIYATSGSTSRSIYVGNLIIEQTA